jgi:hypothetical protein
MLSCCLCHAEDHPIPNGFEEPLHFVRVSFLDVAGPDAVTAKMRRQGWSYKLFQGQHVAMRDVCVDCVIALDLAAAAWKDINAEREAAQNPPDDFYCSLCE